MEMVVPKGISVLIMLVMLRLSLMRANPYIHFHVSQSREMRASERLLLFALTILVTVTGYFLQPAIETILFSAWHDSWHNAVANWLGSIIVALVPGSLTAYVIISAGCGGSRWLKGCAASVLALTAMDFLDALQGGCSLRNFGFSIFCNLIGGSTGVMLVRAAHALFLNLNDSARGTKGGHSSQIALRTADPPEPPFELVARSK
jgi:hypothetical protein